MVVSFGSTSLVWCAFTNNQLKIKIMTNLSIKACFEHRIANQTYNALRLEQDVRLAKAIHKQLMGDIMYWRLTWKQKTAYSRMFYQLATAWAIYGDQGQKLLIEKWCKSNISERRKMLQAARHQNKKDRELSLQDKYQIYLNWKERKARKRDN